MGGVELDDTGAKKKKWSWKDQETHVHAPPFQPICFALNKNIAVRVMGQENIAVTFSAKQRSCRFNVGTKLKVRCKLCSFLMMYSVKMGNTLISYGWQNS